MIANYAYFLPYPGVRLVRPGLWEVVSEGRVHYDIQGRRGVLVIPVGFRFDGASIPPLLRFLLAPMYVLLGMTKTDMENAAAGHDKGYRDQMEKWLADAIFGALLRRRAHFFFGFGRARRLFGAFLAEAAVRFFGGAAYRANGDKLKGENKNGKSENQN